jgi:hypothetical protein
MPGPDFPVALARGGLFALAQITRAVDHDFSGWVVGKCIFGLPIPSMTRAIPSISNQRNQGFGRMLRLA